jgi:hypothetical protein
MDLGADTMHYKANDPLAVGGRQLLACVCKSIRQTVVPDATMGIEHDLGYSSHLAIAAPSALCSMRAPSKTAFYRREGSAMSGRVLDGYEMQPFNGDK